jgi:hypothetical protein
MKRIPLGTGVAGHAAAEQRVISIPTPQAAV